MTDAGGPHLIDVRLGGRERVVGAYLIDTVDGPTLVDCGANSTIDALTAGLARHGVSVDELRHILLTHIHLDHAGGAGGLVARNPQIRVHGAEVGLLHLAYPVVLEHSARGVYGEEFDSLWGSVVAIPEEHLRPVGEQVLGLQCIATPGHASHHVAYLDPDGTLYTGDAAGIRIMPGRHITAATLPPDVDVARWLDSIDAMLQLRPSRLALTHFGIVDDPDAHLPALREVLLSWLALVQGGMGEAEFADHLAAEIASGGEQLEFHKTVPKQMLYQGLLEYVQRQKA
jgi:glyoxylase-like metal-dependent hydrolase (beta-lactamase superfamily II)